MDRLSILITIEQSFLLKTIFEMYDIRTIRRKTNLLSLLSFQIFIEYWRLYGFVCVFTNRIDIIHLLTNLYIIYTHKLTIQS